MRFQGRPADLDREVKPALEKFFTAYFQKHPSERPDPPPELEGSARWYPNHTVHFLPYEPETERYGGGVGLALSETHFQASSNAVLALLTTTDSWSYDRALGAAIQFHLGFAAAMDMDPSEVGEFFHIIFTQWFGSAYGWGQQEAEAAVAQRRKDTLAAFEQQFQNQKDVLLPFLKTYWEALQSRQEFEQDWLNRWLAETKTTRQALDQAQKEGKLIFPKWFQTSEKARTPPDRQWMWSILCSYVHMTNNRLGIFNRDEGYLGYLIQKGMEAL